VSTRPSDYRPPPDSPYVGITLSQHLTATPSGVPQNEHKSVVVPRPPMMDVLGVGEGGNPWRMMRRR